MATVAKNYRTSENTVLSASAGPYSLGFRLFDDDGIKVYVNGILRADYTLTSMFAGGYDDDASITFDSALAINDVLRIDSALRPWREEDLVNGDPSLVAKMNVELARVWSAIADVNRNTLRAVRGFDLIEPVADVDLTEIAQSEAYATAAAASAAAAAASEAAALAAENSLVEWAGAWLTATAYDPSDLVQESGNTYVCLVAHTSGTFATDLSAAKWELFASKGASGAGSGDMVAANNLSDVVDAPSSLANIGGQPVNATLTAFGAASGGASHTVWLPASSFTPTTTSGAALATQELVTNDVMTVGYDFDKDTDEKIQFIMAMPKSWNEGTLTARFVWKDAATAGTGSVVWSIRMLAIGNDDAMDAAFGTVRNVVDGFIASGDLHVSDVSAAITPAGTPAENDLIVIEVFRDADNGTDTYTQDARLLGVKLIYTTNTWTDA